jgi:hypothetical protein
MDLVTMFVAGGYLIKKSQFLATREWWIGFCSLIFVYFLLKSLGVYYDTTAYIIARDSGKTIGGGAAMAHIPLLLCLMGPLQLLSAIGFKIPEIQKFLVILKND